MMRKEIDKAIPLGCPMTWYLLHRQDFLSQLAVWKTKLLGIGSDWNLKRDDCSHSIIYPSISRWM